MKKKYSLDGIPVHHTYMPHTHSQLRAISYWKFTDWHGLFGRLEVNKELEGTLDSRSKKISFTQTVTKFSVKAGTLNCETLMLPTGLLYHLYFLGFHFLENLEDLHKV